jgi:competence protein ComEA
MENLHLILSRLRVELIQVVFVVISALVCLISIFLFLESYNQSGTKISNQNPNVQRRTILNSEKESKKIIVDISGSVKNPDSYEVSAGARLKDVLLLSGGLSDKADKTFFNRNFNLAQLVVDQEKIYIPSVIEVTEGEFVDKKKLIDTARSAQISPSLEAKVNINTATADILNSLPGVGDSTAQKIIDNRPYAQLEDLLNKNVLKKAALEKIQNLIIF